MKKNILSLVLIVSMAVYSQELPTKPASGFAFPLGTKFTIKMHRVDSVNFNYSIIKFDNFRHIINTKETDSLFNQTNDKNGTIEFYFCLGTHGKTEEDKQKNMSVLLLMNNRTKHKFQYNSDIQIEDNGPFEISSNKGSFSGMKTTQMWPYMIQQIGLNEFKSSN